jgi:hypothetical protein
MTATRAGLFTGDLRQAAATRTIATLAVGGDERGYRTNLEKEHGADNRTQPHGGREQADPVVIRS